MINQQLIDYIKKESQRGVTMESTKNALLAIGWSDNDIKKAYTSLSTSASPSKSNKKIIWIVIVLLLISGGGVSAYMFLLIKSTPPVLPVVSAPTPATTTPTTTPPTTSITTPPTTENTNPPTTPPGIGVSTSTNPSAVTPPVVSDADKITTIMNDICQGYITGDNSLISKHASTQTLAFLTNAKLNSGNSCTINKIYPLDSKMVANITVTPTSTGQLSTKLSPVQDMVFIKDGGDWKYDMTATMNFAMEQNKTKALTGDQNGSIDLVVTGIVISPSHPIVNKKDIKVVITIKNTGTKTSDTGTPLVVDLLGFKDETPLVGGSYEPLLPGTTTEWTWYPYKYNDLLKVSDLAGQKTIQIKLNPDRKIIEGNYDNDTFTQVVQMYAK